MKLSLKLKFIVRRPTESRDMAGRPAVPDPAEHHRRHKGRSEVSINYSDYCHHHQMQRILNLDKKKKIKTLKQLSSYPVNNDLFKSVSLR